jgi:hypothetical protein
LLQNQWSYPKKVLYEARDEFVPRKKTGARKKAKWINRKAVMASKKKRDAYAKYRKTLDYTDLEKYKRACNKVTKEYRRARKIFEKKLAKNIKCDSDSKTFFSYVGSQSKTKDGIGPLTDENGAVKQGDLDMCEVLNSFFGTVFTREDITQGRCLSLEESSGTVGSRN